MRYHYECSDCHKVYETEELMYQCPECAKKNDGSSFPRGNLLVKLERDVLERAKAKDHITAEDFYPYVPTKEESEAFPVGPTPLLKSPRLSKELDFKNLYFKLDSLLLSGSFKDRASFLVGLQARRLKENKIVLASTGNAGAAMSAVGAALGLDIVLFVPETAPINKLMQSVLYGAHVVPVKGSYDDAFALSIEYTKKHGGINRNTAYNPMTIEGKKSVAFELFEDLDRNVPDAIYVPVGDGCIISGVAKGFADLLEAGIIGHMPRLIACQSTASDAISRAINSSDFKPIEATTRADSISVDMPANGRMAASFVKASMGWAVCVEDEEILNSQLELTGKAGILAEPAAATAYAAFKRDREHLKRVAGENATAVVLITGTGFKDMKAFDGKVSLPKAIENDVRELDKLSF